MKTIQSAVVALFLMLTITAQAGDPGWMTPTPSNLPIQQPASIMLRPAYQLNPANDTSSVVRYHRFISTEKPALYLTPAPNSFGLALNF